jgi:uncharacterized protein
MKIHLRQIPDGGSHLEGEESPTILEDGLDTIRPLGPIRYDLDVGVSGTGLFATGSLSLPAEFECVSCLEHFARPVDVPDFAMQTELNGSETVDLTPFFREDILLSLPAYPHCDWDGRKVCHGVPMPSVEADEPPADLADPWGDLDKLKAKTK